jgi:hypothetical protein
MEPDLSLIIHWTQLPITDSPATPPTIQVEFGQHGRKDDVRVTERGDRLRVASDRFQLLITARDQYANPSSAPNSFAPSTTAAPGQDPPIWAVQVRARGAEIPDAMLAWLDDDFDGSLSTRELLACGPRLLRVANADGEVRPVDLPDTFLFQLVRGEPRQDALLFDVVPQLPVRTERPRWAESMDMNQDGDIAVNEFLGDIELFQRIDQNRDGFLDPAETQAAN